MRYHKGMKVYVLGSGMSGLATAERLLEIGVKEVEIIEQDSQPGGLAKSFDWGGFAYNDLGPHIWHTPDKKLANDWKNRFGEMLIEGKFWGKNVIGDAPGKYIDYPLSYETLSEFDVDVREKIKAELVDCTKERQIKATNFDEYVLALVGPTLTAMFFKGYPEKLWGVPTSKMSANWAPKRINFTEKPEEFHGSQWAGVGRKGSGGVVDFIYRNIESKGGKFRFNSRVTGLIKEGNTITEIQINSDQKIQVDKEDRVVSTLPFNYFSNLLGLDNSLTYRGALLVYVSLSKPMAILGKAAFLYFAQETIPFHRLSEQKKFCSIGWPANQTTVVAEIAFNENEQLLVDEGKLTEETINSLINFGFATEGEILQTKCIKLPNVYPLMTSEKEIEFKSVYSQIQNFGQVYLIGTGGEYHYADLQILYLKGRDLAERIVSEQNSRFIETVGILSTTPASTFFPSSPFIIAEIGLNHGGSISIAKEMMVAAKESGIKFVKFQTYKSESRISQVYRSNNYFEEMIDTEENLFAMFKKFEFNDDNWRELFRFGTSIDVQVFSAVFDLESLNLLESIGCPAYKIASMDLNNYPLIEEIARTGKPIILSTGMSALGEIERAVKIIERHSPKEFIILHCISSYPANRDSLNLRAMKTLENAFGRPVGFSDHSIGIEAPIVAVSIGAVCVEKHFTLDHNLEGPDHIFSLNPSEMKYLVGVVQDIPGMLGVTNRIFMPQEIETSYKFKKSLHAQEDIQVGEIISKDKIAIKGPFGGIAPEYYDTVIGRIAKVKIEADFPITWESI